jgi:microcin C transport system substrate-binding protein
VTPPVSPEGSDFRDQLLVAGTRLHNAGYTLKGEQLQAPSGQPVSFEVLLSDPTDEKVALNWKDALKRLGIAVTVKTVDSAQYQRRLASFTYDVTVSKWINSLSPGNEQAFFWSTASADQPGSRNYPGVRDPVIDDLVRAVSEAPTREDLIATTHALDRVLMSGHYIIPFYYLGVDDIAYWDEHLHHPETMPLYGTVVESWWYQ